MRVLEAGARDWDVARSRLCPSKCAAGACPLESEMYRAVGTIERNGVGSVVWKTLDFEATEWMGEERRRAVGDTLEEVGRLGLARRWGRGRHQLFVPVAGASGCLRHGISHWLEGASTDCRPEIFSTTATATPLISQDDAGTLQSPCAAMRPLSSLLLICRMRLLLHEQRRATGASHAQQETDRQQQWREDRAAVKAAR